MKRPRYRETHRPAWVAGALLLCVAVSGCQTARRVAAQYPSADIEEIYRQSTANPERNPIVLVPGFLGSMLARDNDGRVLWGEFFTRASMLPSKGEGFSALALDIAVLPASPQHGDLAHIVDDTEAQVVLEQIEALGAGMINATMYSHLTELVETSGYGTCGGLSTSRATFTRPACYSFAYDWRQDIAGSAARFGRFLEAAREQILAGRAREGLPTGEPLRFDVVAHSMGGLVARYYLRFGTEDVLAKDDPAITWAGSELLDRLFLVSPPNFGTMKALKELLRGERHPVVQYQPAQVATFVSLYQMLPRNHHYVWFDANGKRLTSTVLSPRLWREHRWGGFAEDQDPFLQLLFPDSQSASERQDRLEAFMNAAFDRAGRFQRVMDRHPPSPSPIPITLLMADAEPTEAYAMLVLEEEGHRIRFKGANGIDLTAPGDGSVTRASALADERMSGQASPWLRSPVPWTHTIFMTDIHRTLMGNPTFQNNLLHMLLEVPPPERPEDPATGS